MNLGDRMKKYESVNNIRLTERLPIIIRVDGNSFHTYTRGISKNDLNFADAMNEVAIQLCSKISGARFAYVQSDEISVLLNPWNDINSTAWFDNKLQKIVSISAAISAATMSLNSDKIFGKYKPAFFDSRAFVVPRQEVINVFIWRQQDAIRNSVQILGQMNFSHKQLHKKNCEQIKKMLLEEKQIDWNLQDNGFKFGRCIIKQEDTINDVVRKKWVVDNNIPPFSEQRDYIEEKINNERT